MVIISFSRTTKHKQRDPPHSCWKIHCRHDVWVAKCRSVFVSKWFE
uniref:Uncharacterized protein n=1 Tax=Anguilla anguilla TaxID=7936 RepID=A0A0E9VWC2_ANGAN